MPRDSLKAQRLDLERPSERAEALQFSQSLEPIYDLNRRMLALLMEPDREGGTHDDFHAETRLGRVLRETDPPIRQQLALCPFLLLDASFTDATEWQQSQAIAAHAEAAPLRSESVTRVLGLAQAACVLSWHLLQTDRVAATLVLGVSRECAVVIPRCGLTDLQEIAARFVQRRLFKPRWHDRPDVWRRLIRLAQTTPQIPVAIHGLQLFLGDLLDKEGQ